MSRLARTPWTRGLHTTRSPLLGLQGPCLATESHPRPRCPSTCPAGSAKKRRAPPPLPPPLDLGTRSVLSTSARRPPALRAPGCHGAWPPGSWRRAKGWPAALAGNRTRVNCLEGSYAHHYTTNAAQPGPPPDARPGFGPGGACTLSGHRLWPPPPPPSAPWPCPDDPPIHSAALLHGPAAAARRPTRASPTRLGRSVGPPACQPPLGGAGAARPLLVPPPPPTPLLPAGKPGLRDPRPSGHALPLGLLHRPPPQPDRAASNHRGEPRAAGHSSDALGTTEGPGWAVASPQARGPDAEEGKRVAVVDGEQAGRPSWPWRPLAARWRKEAKRAGGASVRRESGGGARGDQKGRLASPSGNRTPVSRVTGGDTHHYTNEDGGGHPAAPPLSACLPTPTPALDALLSTGARRLPHRTRPQTNVVRHPSSPPARLGADPAPRRPPNTPGRRGLWPGRRGSRGEKPPHGTSEAATERTGAREGQRPRRATGEERARGRGARSGQRAALWSPLEAWVRIPLLTSPPFALPYRGTGPQRARTPPYDPRRAPVPKALRPPADLGSPPGSCPPEQCLALGAVRFRHREQPVARAAHEPLPPGRLTLATPACLGPGTQVAQPPAGRPTTRPCRRPGPPGHNPKTPARSLNALPVRQLASSPSAERSCLSTTGPSWTPRESCGPELRHLASLSWRSGASMSYRRHAGGAHEPPQTPHPTTPHTPPPTLPPPHGTPDDRPALGAVGALARLPPAPGFRGETPAGQRLAAALDQGENAGGA
ncbi:basic proline-rich protein-like [Mustela putorius furo]|uniref:Basic proline-rich protein-like n=1 Tax=Mustela putorius furo TaxID=9669 RepID=A0A8U0SIR3_MUSPF|nr:basic proline-rich protein-like [Mustela putorius furo]